MSMRNKMVSSAAACVLGGAVAAVSAPVFASDAGAFIGGGFATKVLSNVERRTRAQEAQAASAQQSRSVSAAPAQKSPQDRLAELDSLAAGGYITPEEYKRKKQQIIDSM